MASIEFYRRSIVVILVSCLISCTGEEHEAQSSQRGLFRRPSFLPKLPIVRDIVSDLPVIGDVFKSTFDLQETSAKFGIPEEELADPDTVSSTFPESVTERLINRVMDILTGGNLALPIPVVRSNIFVADAPFRRYKSCESEYFGTGHCRFVHHCLIPDLIFRPMVFLQHVCLVNNLFIGICCPDESYVPRPPNPATGQSTKPPPRPTSVPTLSSRIPGPGPQRPTPGPTTLPVTRPEPQPSGPQEPEAEDPEYDSGIKGCGLSFKPRIVGGRNADPEDWLWMAAILNKTRSNRHYCGGVLITKTHVLTAAHCMRDPAEAILVRVGEYDLRDRDETKEQDYDVREIITHPMYDKRTHDHDIAILKLTRTVSFTTYVRPVCMPVPRRDYFDEEATVVGWGNLDYGGPAATILQQVEVPVWNNTDCSDTFREAAKTILPQQLCAGTADGTKDSCSGDSGGPLMVPGPRNRWMVIGVVSLGINCAEVGFPGVYTRVTEYLEWIYENVADYGNLIDRRHSS